MANFNFSLQDPALLGSLDLFGRSLNGNHNVTANPTLLTQLSGQQLKNGNAFFSPQITKRPNPFEMEQPMTKKLKSQLVLGGQDVNLHDLTSQSALHNSGRLNLLFSNLNEQELNHQIPQFQTPLDILHANSLLNMGQNNLFQSKLFHGNQRSVNLQDLMNLSVPTNGLSLDLLSGLTRVPLNDISLSAQLGINPLELIQQQQQLQQQQQQHQQQQQQQKMMLQNVLLQNAISQLNAQPMLDISSLSQLSSLDELTLSSLQNPLLMGSNAPYFMLQSGQLIPMQQNQYNLMINPQSDSLASEIAATQALLKKQSSQAPVEQANPKIPQLYIPDPEVQIEERKNDKNSGLISDDSTKCSDFENKTEDEPEAEESKTTPIENKPKIARPKKVTLFSLKNIKSPEEESPDSNKNGERRKNRWQVVQEEKEKAIMAEKVRLINESNIRHEDQKITNTPIGPNHQADLQILTQLKDKPKRVIKQKWNPDNISEEDLSAFATEIELMTEMSVDQQKLLILLNESNCNTSEVLKNVKNEKKKYINFFNLKLQKKKTLL